MKINFRLCRLPLIAAAFFPPTGPAISGDGTFPEATLSVLSYNIQCRPVLDRSAEKSVLIGRRLRTYDLVGVQEAFTEHDRLFAAAKPLHGVYFGRRRHRFKLVNSGLAVLSRYPVAGTAMEYFNDEGSLENRLGSKGVLMVRLAIGGTGLDFFTTHLAAGSEAESGAARRRELVQIVDFIRRHRDPDNAIILCGDFNLPRPELGVLEASGLQNCAVPSGGSRSPAIDHIYFQSGRRLRLHPERSAVLKSGFRFPDGSPLSDHYPLEAVFRLEIVPQQPEPR